MIDVRPAQPLLFPDPKPLVERLGLDFFRSLPECPGVYLMRDASDTILYVGKAKNLRRRLGSYRVANPDRMPRRHLRLVRLVVRIELQPCADECSALAKEAELLRSVRPRFNRAGTWRPPPRYFVWRRSGQELQLAVTESPLDGWRSQGPVGSMATFLRHLLAKLMWLAVHPQRGLSDLPCGWFGGQNGPEISVDCGTAIDAVLENIDKLFGGASRDCVSWLREQICPNLTPFEVGCLEADYEQLLERFPDDRATPDRIPESEPLSIGVPGREPELLSL